MLHVAPSLSIVDTGVGTFTLGKLSHAPTPRPGVLRRSPWVIPIMHAALFYPYVTLSVPSRYPKELLDKALARDSKEFSLLHMRGRYSYSVANLSWIERKAASVFYATPPTATMEEALEDFLAAYEEKPDWIENLIYIARIYLAKGDKENAKNFFSKVIALTPTDEDERDRVREANKSLAKC
ncbi:hypothetical protein Y032_0455g1761 [Ancylostoma ceylanicum]|uniref:Uncharacterized protein n=1 Tax=Ancylostoma ceylanicum TaxID=53326 RepID=A0A016WXU4_9BILA|nr:hypothetical protein Y032_0455g1761 [Ancylostoma ceylanicum]